MGLFGKKPAPAGSNIALQEKNKTVGSYVAPAETPAPVAPSPARSVKSAQEGADLEKGAAASTVASKPKSTVANAISSVFSPSLNVDGLNAALEEDDGGDDDDPTIDSKTDDGSKTYDDGGTFQTNDYTAAYGVERNGAEDDSQSKDSAFTITRNGQYLTMNGFANGHLMRWKFAAEEGPAFIRFPAVILAVGVIGTTLYPIVTNTFMWNLSTIICAVHTCITAALILILEGRVVIGYRAPTNFRARVRAVVTRYLNLFRLLWGRGLLYIFVATMNMTIDHPFAVYTGLALAVFGLFAVASGAHASYNLDKMKTSLTDEAYLWSRFDALDSDGDNNIDLNEFAELLWALGLEFDDAYTYKAFSQIDGDAGATISFEQFRDWWIVTQNKGRRLKNNND